MLSQLIHHRSNALVSDTLQFFSTEEGRGRVSNNSFAYDYFLKDHLDNTRMVLTDDYNASSPILEATALVRVRTILVHHHLHWRNSLSTAFFVGRTGEKLKQHHTYGD